MTQLRWIWLDGPPLLRDDAPQKPRGAPLWSLLVGASYFDRANAADYAHTLRTLMVDARETNVSVEGAKPFFQTGKPQHPLRAPRLFDVHVIAGAGKAPYRANKNGNRETLQLNGYPTGSKVGGELVNKDLDKPIFSTVGGHHDAGGTDAQEGFVRVVAEPQLPAAPQKGDFVDQAGHTGKDDENAIRVPRLRLLLGAIRLKIAGPLPWLGNIDPGKALPSAPTSFELILTPSGIEIVTAVEFPGVTGKLPGVFRIASRDQRAIKRNLDAGDVLSANFNLSALTLTLLPNETAQLPAEGLTKPIWLWSDAWRNATAPHDDSRCGLDLRPLPSSLPPAFSWPLYLKKGGAALVVATNAVADPPLAVDAPTDRLRIELRGSKGPDGSHAGAALLMTSRLRIAAAKAAGIVEKGLQRQNCLPDSSFSRDDGGVVVFAEARPDGETVQKNPPGYWTVSEIETAGSVTMSLRVGGTDAMLPLAHDEHLLAARLRAVAGWEEPRPQLTDAGRTTGYSQADRPVVSGFVPLERGWLQLPFANLPPLDTRKDSSLLGAIDPTPASVLDGFIRIAQRPVVPMQSGYQEAVGSPVGDTAPWSVTVEGAGAAVVMCAIEDGVLKRSRVVLREPDLATRGLLWLSADRPDAMEALPRLGAGPGSFFDLDLTTTPAPDPKSRIVTVSLSSLKLTFKSDGTATRDDMNVSLAFNPSATDWANGLATGEGGSALARARAVLLGDAEAPGGSADLEALREARDKAEKELASANASLAAMEDELARAKRQSLNLDAQIAELGTTQKALMARHAGLTKQRDKALADENAARANVDSTQMLEFTRLAAIDHELAKVNADWDKNTGRLKKLGTEKAALDGGANLRSEKVNAARVVAERARLALAQAEPAATDFKIMSPWPAVAWLRHPRLPLAAGMPMTRSAASAVPPLESRELAPFVATTVVLEGAICLATLAWSGKKAFPEVSASPAFERLASGWPRPDKANGGQILGPSEGVPFAAFGVPGIEIMPRDKAREWTDPDFAVRYDLPALDEAFATSGLPPTAEPLAQQDEREKAQDKPAATALDWPLLKSFWEEQERRRNISLVLDSYLDEFRATTDTQPLQVRTLIRGAIWSVKATFEVNYDANDLSYGAVAFGDGAKRTLLVANSALAGLSGTLSFKSPKVIELNSHAPGAPAFQMLGWSPSSFDSSDFRVDNQGFGIANPQRGNGLITRRFRGELGAGERIFASTEKEIAIAGPVPFGFWFKDLPLASGGVFERGIDAETGMPETAADFSAWLSPQEGYEWRLYRKPSRDRDDPEGGVAARSRDAAAAAFEDGRDRIPFFGMEIEPLRLLFLELPASQGLPTSSIPRKMQILARMFFADDPDQPITGGNLIIMTFASNTGDLRLDSIAGVGKTPLPLAFAFEALSVGSRTGSSSPSRARSRSGQVLLQATPAWVRDRLTFSQVSLSISLHGRNVRLESATVTCDDENGSVDIDWLPRTAQPAIKPGQGRLRVTHLSIKRASVADRDHVEMSIDRAVEICSVHGREGDPEIVALFNQSGASNVFSLLNSKFVDVAGLHEEDHALAFAFNATVSNLEGLLPGLANGAASVDAAIMLAATVDRPTAEQPWVLPLGCGRCEGEIRAKSGKAESGALHIRRVRWEFDGRLSNQAKPAVGAPSSNTKEPFLAWDGFVSISGELSQTSAIVWPRLKTGKGATDGRRRITLDSDLKPLCHEARYVFQDHRLPLEVCRATGRKWTFDRPWTTFAAASHKLVEHSGDLQASGPIVLEWSGLESFAIGHVDDLIPKLPAADTIEAVTFAPRYRFAYSGAAADTAKMMIQPGLGAIQTVLDGMSGRAFRDGFAKATGAKEIVAVAGFLGLQMSDSADRNAEEPLLRLPFLAGLGPDPLLKPCMLNQSDFPTGGIEVAWVDSAAARSLLIRDDHAVAPASAIEADLVAAVRAGALVNENGQPPSGEIVAAMAAEQTFRASPLSASAAPWPNAPYWIGSAVTISRTVERCARDKTRRFRPLSLVAGSILSGKQTRGAAALARGLPATLLDQPPTVVPSALISGGTIVTVEDWRSADPAQADGSLNGYAAGLAAVRHARPLFAVVRFVDGRQIARYSIVTLPRTVREDLPTIRCGSREQTRFAEGARGYAISPGEKASHWLSPVVEGPIAAVRDEKSGLAGLGRRLNLPAQAGEAVALDTEPEEKVAQSLVWFTEKRNPVYLPLGIDGMESPAIPWLQAAPPRVRLPADADVAAVLRSSGLGDQANVPKRMAAQSFLPDRIDSLAVSARPGIVTARRAFLMGAAASDHVFDAEQARFGRAAQAGSSTRRWMRTPRPSMLPANTGDASRDRRPEASPLLPLAPLRFLVGPADTVRGVFLIRQGDRVSGVTDQLKESVGESVQWSATLVAAPSSDGVLSDRWDGSIRLTVELDVSAVTTKDGDPVKHPPNAAQLLSLFLFPAEHITARAQGSLKVGDQLVGLRWITIQKCPDGWEKLSSAGKAWVAKPDDETKEATDKRPPNPIVWRRRVDIILDPREERPPIGGAAGGVHVGLAAALSAGAFAIELRLTVHPTQTGATSGIAVGQPISLKQAEQGALAVGAHRPPLTLRWTLPAVTAIRGGMPLAPSTLLFVDPAYEAGLANPPHEKSVLVNTENVENLPGNRGAVRAFLSADRGRVNRHGAVAFMADVRFERRPEPLAPAVENDFVGEPAPLALLIKLIPRAPNDQIRFLNVSGKADPPVSFGAVYELSLGTLTEADGSPARLQAGDVLELTVREPEGAAVQLTMHNTELGPGGESKAFSLSKPNGSQSAAAFGLSLPLILTDEPVVEPPAALYTALTHAIRSDQSTLSLPLYAQSPLPWRVDFRDLKNDFRTGLVRRSATFVWGMARPRADLGISEAPIPPIRCHIVKSDRNGQTYFPSSTDEFLQPDRIGPAS